MNAACFHVFYFDGIHQDDKRKKSKTSKKFFLKAVTVSLKKLSIRVRNQHERM